MNRLKNLKEKFGKISEYVEEKEILCVCKCIVLQVNIV